MNENNDAVSGSESAASGTRPTGGSKLPEGSGDLGSVVEQLQLGKPLILNDGYVIADSGYMVSSQYVDIGVDKLRRRPPVLVKAIEAQYGLEHALSIQLSTPHRFRNYGETFIRDDQEGRARRENKTESTPRSYEDSTREQQRALHLLGQKNVTIRATEVTGGNRESESLVFGKSSWIYCTSILPAPSERERRRATLPGKYDHESTIRQPAKFAFALGAMFANQIGPQEKRGRFTHNTGIVSLHRSQLVLHGPVWYTDDVLVFLKSFESEPLYTMYPLFVKHSRFKDQREYRFVLHCESPVEHETQILNISGAMRDALAPPRSAIPVVFQPPNDPDTGSSSRIAMETIPGNKTTTRSRTTSQKRQRTVTVDGQIVEKETHTREEAILLTTKIPADGPQQSADILESKVPGVGQVTQTENRELWVDGDRVDTMAMSRTRVYSVADTSGADELFTLEERNRAAELLEAVRRPFANFPNLPPQVAAALKTLAGQVLDIEPNAEVQAMSACWNGIWAICNLYECFGDVVDSVGIEQSEFVTIGLKDSKHSGAEAKILVGPRGTFAYALTRGEKQRTGNGGTETRLFFFPDDQARAEFEEFGWTPLVKEQRSSTEPTTPPKSPGPGPAR